MSETVNRMKLDLELSMTLTTVLQAALASAKSLPVMFCLLEGSDGTPTPGQIALSEEILNNVLNDFEIEDSYRPQLASCLMFMLDDFDMHKDSGKDNGSEVLKMPPMTGYEYIQRMYGINYTKDFRKNLLTLVHMFEPSQYGYCWKEVGPHHGQEVK